MSREIEIAGKAVEITENAALENDAGAVVWDCALVLAHYFDYQASRKRNNFLKGRRVIELGAGQYHAPRFAILAKPTGLRLSSMP